MSVADNTFEIDVTEDGKIVVRSGKFAGAIHKNADDFLAWLQSMAGGMTEKKKLASNLKNQQTHQHGSHHHHH